MKNVFVGNMHVSTTETDLRKAFEAYGTVEQVSIITDRDSGRPRGFAFVEMENDKEAQAALAGLHGSTLSGNALTVSEAKPKIVRARN
jgi:cold-inducible RNA-binding protein